MGFPSFDELKANPRLTAGGIRYIPDVSGFVQPGTVTVGDNDNVLYVRNSDVTKPFPENAAAQGVIAAHSAGGSLNGDMYIGLAGWDKFGSPQVDVVKLSSSAASAVSEKRFGFIPGINFAKLIANANSTGSRPISFKVGSTSGAVVAYAPDTEDSSSEILIPVPPGGFAKINYLKVVSTAAQNFAANLQEMSAFNDDVKTLIGSGNVNNTSSTLIDKTYSEDYILVEGGKYGKVVYVEVTGDNAASAGNVEIQFDVFARWFPDLQGTLQKRYQNLFVGGITSSHDGS